MKPLLCLVLSIHVAHGFFGDLLESEMPLHFVSGICSFYSSEGYQAGQMEVVIKTDSPTIDLYSSNFLTLGRLYNGQSYKITNIYPILNGRTKVSFTVVYIGSPFRSPKAWCENISLPKREKPPKPMFVHYRNSKPKDTVNIISATVGSQFTTTPSPLPIIPSQPYTMPYQPDIVTSQPNPFYNVQNLPNNIPNKPYNEANQPNRNPMGPFNVPNRPYINPMGPFNVPNRLYSVPNQSHYVPSQPPTRTIPPSIVPNQPTIIPSQPYTLANQPSTTPRPQPVLPTIPFRPRLA